MSYLKSISSIADDEAKRLGDVIYYNSVLFRNELNIASMVLVSEDFFWDYLSLTHLKEYVLDLVSNLKVVKDKGFSEISKEIQNAIRSNPLPQQLFDEIKTGYEALGVDDKKLKIISLFFSKKNVPCVLGVSFNKTGFSQESLDSVPRYINVVGIDKINDLIINIFASFFSKNVLEEKIKNGRPLLEPLGPLYLQRFVYFDKSGYAFPVDDNSKFVVECVPGMIFSLSNEEVTPDRIVFDFVSSEIVDVTLGYKGEKYVFDKKTDVIQKVENLYPEELSLSEPEILLIARTMKKIIDVLGSDAKLEFGLFNGDLYVTEIKREKAMNIKKDESISKIDDEKEVILKMDENNDSNDSDGNVFEIDDNDSYDSVSSSEHVVKNDSENALSKDGGVPDDNSKLSESKSLDDSEKEASDDSLWVAPNESDSPKANSESNDDADDVSIKETKTRVDEVRENSSENNDVSESDFSHKENNSVNGEDASDSFSSEISFDHLEDIMDAVISKFVRINPSLKDSLELFKEEFFYRLKL